MQKQAQNTIFYLDKLASNISNSKNEFYDRYQ